jgi:hypothetical protein
MAVYFREQKIVMGIIAGKACHTNGNCGGLQPMLKNDVIITGNQWPIDDSDEVARLKRIRENEILFRGRLEEIDSMRNWYQRVTRNWDLSIPSLVAANFYKPITLLCADLLYGEQGELVGASCSNTKANEAMKRIIEDNHLNALVYEVGGLASSYRGNGLYSAAYNNVTRKVEIYPQPANYWFPVVDQGQVKKIKQHIIAWPEKHNNRFYLRKQIHEAGKVYNYAFELMNCNINTSNKNSVEQIITAKIGRQVKLSDLDLTIQEIVDTRIDKPLIINCPNWAVDNDVYAVDDYEDLDSLILELAIMLSRNSMVLSKHTDPNMYGDPSFLQQDELTGAYKLPIGGAFFPLGQDGAPPGYMTWDGKLEAAEAQIDRLVNFIFYISETSPAAFGMDKSSSTESGAALKKRLMRTLAKVNRKKMYADPAIKDVLETAMMLDFEWAGGNYEVERPSITWSDGLPNDPKEDAEVVGQRVKDGTMSKLKGIMVLDNCDEEMAKKELARIQEEQDAALPAFARSQTGGTGNGQEINEQQGGTR